MIELARIHAKGFRHRPVFSKYAEEVYPWKIFIKACFNFCSEGRVLL